ncbi:ORF2 [Haloarcula hispanica pleomorphic virus 1]|uniref:ORF2 n=1 Tax=Haloarcula hispanica pleomorphic virus 1 TaxID=710112 RepID=D3JVB9_9VIRU|nr:unkown [Haloarcula hispanica pleomorphic virus 1]ADB79718.1 ORF2 [Haloarcula hispanica pleomorphic virus 1]
MTKWMSRADDNTDGVSFDDLEDVEVEDSGSGWINPDAGEEVIEEIKAFDPDAGDYGVVELGEKERPYSLNYSEREKMMAALVKGSVMAIRVSETEESFKNDEGETVTYNPKEVRFGSGD